MLLIEPEARIPRSALAKRELSRFVTDVCGRIGLAGEVTVLLSSDNRLRELNRTYRRKDQATDVLSFPAAELPGQTCVGDLAISADAARRQAEALGHEFAEEVRILVLHGLLHLAGFDHESDSGAMARKERTLRRYYELPAGLIQRTEKAGTR